MKIEKIVNLTLSEEEKKACGVIATMLGRIQTSNNEEDFIYYLYKHISNNSLIKYIYLGYCDEQIANLAEIFEILSKID